MPNRNSEYLFDITTRLALFVEGIKLWQSAEFNAVLVAVDVELRKTLGRVEYKTLDGLTKAQLNHLLLSLRKSQARIYNAYTQKFIRTLEDFMRVRLEVSAMAYASAKHNFTNSEPTTFDEAGALDFIQEDSKAAPFSPVYGLAAILGGGASLWSTIKHAPIPANGLFILPFVQTFSRSAQASVENTIRKAWTNKQTVAETLAEISGNAAKQGKSTQFAKITLQANAVIDTSIAHVDNIVAQAVISAMFSHYQWHSIIDGSTTAICRERDHMVYRYGAGPIPPAHYRCRSITVPLASILRDFDIPTLYAWMKRQLPEVQQEFLGKDAATLLSSGKLTSKEFASAPVGKALNLTQFKSKLGLILS